MTFTPEPADSTDRSNGWEAVAPWFISTGSRSKVGVAIVQAWAEGFPPGATMLDLGCGPGSPRSEPLVNRGFSLYAVDASPSLANAYQSRFPSARVVCEAAEESSFFGETFDGVLSWGLLFLLAPDTQRALIQRVAAALKPRGRFLFTAPSQVCTWADNSTGRRSESLGVAAYDAELSNAGLVLAAEYDDEGENHYYDAVKQ